MSAMARDATKRPASVEAIQRVILEAKGSL